VLTVFQENGIVMQSQRHHELGQIVPLFAILLVVLVGSAGLALDFGQAALKFRQAQNVADASALAAAYVIHLGQSIESATQAAENLISNYGYSLSQVSIGFYTLSGQATTTVASVAYVKVSVTASVTLDFMGALNILSPAVTATAEAAVGGPPCSLCLISSSGTALYTNDSGIINVQLGNITVDSSSSNAAVATNSSSVTAKDGTIEIVGNYSTSQSGYFSPTPQVGANPVENPFASLPAPQISNQGVCVSGSIQQQGYCNVGSSSYFTAYPGVYTSIQVQQSGSLVMEPGIYVITGTSSSQGVLSVSNSAIVSGNGVTIYFACYQYPVSCNPGQSGSYFTMSDSATYTVGPPSSGTYSGLSLEFDPNNTAGVSMSDSALLATSPYTVGSIYDPSGQVSITDSASATVQGLIVANSVIVSNSGSLTIEPEQPALGNKFLPYLVY